VIALVAGALGFGGMAGAAAGMAKILFFLFVAGFVIFLALGVMAGLVPAIQRRRGGRLACVAGEYGSPAQGRG